MGTYIDKQSNKMLLINLILVPVTGMFLLSSILTYNVKIFSRILMKATALLITIIALIISLIMFSQFDFSCQQFQFVQEQHNIGYFDFHLGVDGLSIYFILLTTIIIPISLISNWKSVKENTMIFVVVILLIEILLLIDFLILNSLLFYVFFESILAPLFVLIGIYGSDQKVRASFYFFLYTLLGSLFMLLSIVTTFSLLGSTDFSILSRTSLLFLSQLFLLIGIFIAFAVKTPVIYLNNWLLKAHVESPLAGSIILAAIVLKLSIYGILRLILPLLSKGFLHYTYLIFTIGIITIIYGSLSTIRTIDIKELIAYSSVCHAAVYLLGLFSNTIQGIEGGILLGLAHGFVSSGLFICVGGILYDRSHTRLITNYRGIANKLPLFAIFFLLLCLGNCGVPLTLNFIGEFMSLYGIFERLSLAGVLASLSIVFSAAYTIFTFNRICFSGTSISYFWIKNAPDLNKREFFMLFCLVVFVVVFGVYPAPILDGLHYSITGLISSNFYVGNIHYDYFEPWDLFFQDNAIPQMEALEELHNNVMFYLAIIMFAVTWIFITTVCYYIKGDVITVSPVNGDGDATGNIPIRRPNINDVKELVAILITVVIVGLSAIKTVTGGGSESHRLITLLIDNGPDFDVCKNVDLYHLGMEDMSENFNLHVKLKHIPTLEYFYINMPSTYALDKMLVDINTLIDKERELQYLFDGWVEDNPNYHDTELEREGLNRMRYFKSIGLLIRNLESVYVIYRRNYTSSVPSFWYEDEYFDDNET